MNNNKFDYNWNFNKDDWFINSVMENSDIIFEICRLKEYSVNKISKIVFDITTIITDKRNKLEEESPEFNKKKNYLLMHAGDEKVQITLEEEYLLKSLIEKYKIYELIGWLHLGKNPKVFQYCIIEKQKILNQIYPIIDLTIRKVIGSKVININNKENYDLFEESVDNAWVSIIKYLTKIDTSKVMFSVLVATAQRSAIYFKYNHLRYKYSTSRISDLKFINENTDEKSVTEEIFVNTVNNTENINELKNTYNETINDIDEDLEEDTDDNKMFYLEDADEDEIDKIISDIDGDNDFLKQNILAHSFDIMSGKIKKICFDKIFAEFFYDLINQKISLSVIEKHSNILIEIMDLISINPELINDEEKNIEIYKMFRSWIKDKIKTKLNKYNINTDNDKSVRQSEDLVKREKNMLDYLKKNKLNVIQNLLKFKTDCIKFKVVMNGE